MAFIRWKTARTIFVDHFLIFFLWDPFSLSLSTFCNLSKAWNAPVNVKNYVKCHNVLSYSAVKYLSHLLCCFLFEKVFHKYGCSVTFPTISGWIIYVDNVSLLSQSHSNSQNHNNILALLVMPLNIFIGATTNINLYQLWNIKCFLK